MAFSPLKPVSEADNICLLPESRKLKGRLDKHHFGG